MSSDYADRSLAVKSGAAGPALPLATRILLWLSTAPFRPRHWMDPRIRARLAELAEAGWTLRAAPPRNFLLWRHGWTLTSTRAPLLVLPLDFGKIDVQGRNIFLATEIVMAENRVAGRASDPEADARISAFCASTASSLGVTVNSAEPQYRKALRDIEARV